jgi:AraC-like DNA-binding protein
MPQSVVAGARGGTCGAGQPPSARLLAHGADWSVSEYTCHYGPDDRPFEEMHSRVTIAMVAAGSFRYRASTGTALLHPGSFLLGNCGAAFECGHEHGVGDRCIAFQFSPGYFAEIAATAAGSAGYRFRAAMLPALARLLPLAAAIETLAMGRPERAIEEAVPAVAEAVLAAVSGHAPGRASVAARDQKRLTEVLRFMETHAAEDLDLDRLAAVARLSRYHFLRTFRQSLGLSPYQYLIGLRMRRAAVALRTCHAPVSATAFEAGFGDLSTFGNRFRALFGQSPSAFRAGAARNFSDRERADPVRPEGPLVSGGCRSGSTRRRARPPG